MIKTTNNRKVDPKVKEVLKLLGLSTLLTASLIMPGIGFLVKEYQKEKIKKDKKEWEKFNLWRLRQVIKRLEKQKTVEIFDGIVRITEKGKQKLLQYDLERMELKRKTDGNWRLIVYDVSNLRKVQRDLFRSMLKRLNFLRLQESVYLTPFVCDDEIEYLKQIFCLNREVQILKLSGIEKEQVYRNYFGI